MEKHGEPALLAVVEAVVERLGGAGQLLQVGGAGAQALGRAGETVDRVDFGSLIVTRLALFSPSGEALGPLLGELDPVPYATVEQARRLAALRASLLRKGAWSTAAIADARGITTNNARQWVSRHRKAHRIFTVTHDGETLVPAFLLDDELEPRPTAHQPIRLLHDAGEDGWALWAWFATASAWVGGRIPAELLASDPDLVAQSARQRAAAAG